MRSSTLRLIFLLILVSCEYDSIDSGPLQGVYKGQFDRMLPAIDIAPSNVTLTLANGKFSGESDRAKFPAICKGSYKVVGQEIEFVNECVWTADFDWSLILSGKFQFHKDGRKLELTKNYSPIGQIDTYHLTLQ